MTHQGLLENIAASNSGIEAVEHIREFENEIIERCYLAARGTEKLMETGNRQMYWKGRADAASDVRFLKGKI